MFGRAVPFHSPAQKRPDHRGHFSEMLRMFLLAILAGALLPLPALRAAEAQSKQQAKGNQEDAARTPVNEARASGPVAESPSALEEVLDNPEGHWEFFKSLGLEFHLPKIGPFQITKYMIMELVAAVLIAAIYIPLARKLRRGEPSQGWRQGLPEVLLTFIRDEVARPGIGEHDADRFVPFLWTMFLFILFNNLIGMLPTGLGFGSSPTASIFVTGALALCVFFAIHGAAIAKMGFAHYVQTYWPHIDAPFGMGYVLKPLIFVLELVGVIVRNIVLAIRLFANLFAGHMVSGRILLFIVMAGNAANVGLGLWSTITLFSVFGVVALSLLELFVAFLQAYIFVFLTAIFMGLALHPQH